MIGLVLLASHMVGDFVFQSRWQSERKLTDARVRWRHVLGYCLAFVPVTWWACWAHGWKAAPFLPLLALLHFATDSHRFRSTLGDRVGWMFASDADKIAAHVRPNPHGGWFAPRSAAKLSLPVNPWPAMPLMIDQSLHLVQLAVLGWLLT